MTTQDWTELNPTDKALRSAKIGAWMISGMMIALTIYLTATARTPQLAFYFFLMPLPFIALGPLLYRAIQKTNSTRIRYSATQIELTDHRGTTVTLDYKDVAFNKHQLHGGGAMIIMQQGIINYYDRAVIQALLNLLEAKQARTFKPYQRHILKANFTHPLTTFFLWPFLMTLWPVLLTLLYVLVGVQ